MEGWMNVLMNGWMDECIGGRVDGWMYWCTYALYAKQLHYLYDIIK